MFFHSTDNEKMNGKQGGRMTEMIYACILERDLVEIQGNF